MMAVERVAVDLATDGRVWVDGVEVRAASVEAARAAAVARVEDLARRRRRPLRMVARDPDGRVHEVEVAPPGVPADPDARTMPAEYAGRMAAIKEASTRGSHRVAEGAVEALRREVCEEHGPGHPYALRVRELHAIVLARAGQPAEGVAMALDVAEGWRVLGSPDAAWEAIQCAGTLWERLGGVHSGSGAWLGERLAHALARHGERGASARAAVLRRVDQLRMR
ncbi:hypothetical protein OIE91_31495 [Streptomyces albidoflavus]|uniref:hypothetical protein n=1 Tax=Streptomyces TaxID=1883 RepID=UPI000CD53892|nr:hypothetical protein [Streptomyces sp. SM17]AWL36680.1 hypothetical protein B9S66_31565 [Streptomyces sp. SM17]